MGRSKVGRIHLRNNDNWAPLEGNYRSVLRVHIQLRTNLLIDDDNLLSWQYDPTSVTEITASNAREERDIAHAALQLIGQQQAVDVCSAVTQHPDSSQPRCGSGLQ